MATKELRNYGKLGGTPAGDKTTWLRAVADCRSGDELHLAYLAGQNDVKLPAGGANRKSGVSFAIDEAVRLFPQSRAESFPGANATGILFGLGNTNGRGKGDYAGKWQIVLDPSMNPGCGPHTSVMRFTSASQIRFEHLAIKSSAQHNDATGQPGPNANTVASFAYPSAGKTPCHHIYLLDVFNDTCTAGYGLCQVQSGNDLYFTDIKCHGGTCLRIEQDAGQLMIINRLTAEGVWARFGNCAVQLNAHGHRATGIKVTKVTAQNMMRALRLDQKDSGSITGVAVRGGPGAQVKTRPGSPSVWYKYATSESVLDPDGDSPGGLLRVSDVYQEGSFTRGTQGFPSPIPAGMWGAGF